MRLEELINKLAEEAEESGSSFGKITVSPSVNGRNIIIKEHDGDLFGDKPIKITIPLHHSKQLESAIKSVSLFLEKEIEI